MAQARYPLAVWKGDGQTGGSYIGLPYRLVLHAYAARALRNLSGGIQTNRAKEVSRA